ncbi:MAG: phytanoyl-CoA dioxygenase family protein [Gammaproteobacteria bacterium]|nr:phytanoyl-CoA dioxygenase family protein [Gammaproteobacteria bacterium]
MDIANLGKLPDTDAAMLELDKHDLVKNALELDAYGLTIVPREKLDLPDNFVERLRSAILRTCEQRNGIEIGDYRTAEPKAAEMSRNSWSLIDADDVFIEAALNPQSLALVRWLCGQSAVLTGNTWIIKPPTDKHLGLHSDAHGIPPGGGHVAHVCNASWICTDYDSADDGPTVFVPGSHRYGRATLPHEQKLDESALPVVPLHAEAGSLAIWHGATWHGSTPRKNPGLRVTLVQVYMRLHMRPITMWNNIAPELYEKYPDLRRVLGEHLYPYNEHNDHPERVGPFMRTGTDPFA